MMLFSESIKGLIGTLKTVTFSGGDAPNAVDVYVSQVGETVNYSTVIVWFQTVELSIRSSGSSEA